MDFGSSNFNPHANVDPGGSCFAFAVAQPSLIDVQLRLSDRSASMKQCYDDLLACAQDDSLAAEVPYWLTVVSAKVNEGDQKVKFSLKLGRAPAIENDELLNILSANSEKAAGLLNTYIFPLSEFQPRALGPAMAGARPARQLAGADVFVSKGHQAAANKAQELWVELGCDSLSEQKKFEVCVNASLSPREDWRVICNNLDGSPMDSTIQLSPAGASCPGNADLNTMLERGVEYAVVVVPSNYSLFQYKGAQQEATARSMWESVATSVIGKHDRFWSAARSELAAGEEFWYPTSRQEGTGGARQFVPPLPDGYPAGLGLFTMEVYANPGSIELGSQVPEALGTGQRAASVCGNGIVEGYEQCDSRGPVPALDRQAFGFDVATSSELEHVLNSEFKTVLDGDWCTRPKLVKLSPNVYNSWKSGIKTLVNPYVDIENNGGDMYDEDPVHLNNGMFGGGCTGVIASFSFDIDTVEVEEGQSMQITVKRELPPHWLPHYVEAEEGVTVRVSSRNGVGKNAAEARRRRLGEEGSNVGDYVAIKDDDLVFAVGETSKTFEVMVNNDNTDEYQTEYFELYLTLVPAMQPSGVCEKSRDCVYHTKLGHPHEMRIEITGTKDWFGTEFKVMVGVSTGLLVLLSAWVRIWTLSARKNSMEKYQISGGMGALGGLGDDSPSFGMGNNTPSRRGGTPASGYGGNASPGFGGRGGRSPSIASGSMRSNSIVPSGRRSNSIAPAPMQAPGSMRSNSISVRSGSIAQGMPGQMPGGARRGAVLNVDDVAGVPVAQEQPAARVSSKSSRKEDKKSSGRGRSSKGANEAEELDDALKALAQQSQGMGSRRGRSQSVSAAPPLGPQSRRSRSGSVAAGLSDRVRGGGGGDEIAESSVRIVAELSERIRGGGGDDDEPKSKPSGRHRRGSVKELKDGNGEDAPRSSGRHRRGSVKEVASAAKVAAVLGGGGKSSSGRHRRGSVKEIQPSTDGASSGRGPAPASSGRHRRGSVKEVQPSGADAMAAVSSASVTTSRRHRRASAAAMGDFEAPSGNGPAKERSGSSHLSSATMPASGGSRRRRTSVAETPGADFAAAATVASVTSKSHSGRHRRGSVKEVDLAPAPAPPPAANALLNEGPVVSGMDFGSISQSRRQRDSAPSPVAKSASPSFRKGGGTSGSATPKVTPKGAKAKVSPSFRGDSSARGDVSAQSAQSDEPDSKRAPRRTGGYQNAALFTATQAALAHSQQVLDEHKGLIGKCRIVGPVLYGLILGGGAVLLYMKLTKTELTVCETETDCKAYQVGDGKCDWVCNNADCLDDGGDCALYTPECSTAWDPEAYKLENTSALYGEIFVSAAGTTTGCFAYNTSGRGEPMTFPLNDTICDLRCNHQACGFDGGDCRPEKLKMSSQCSEGCYIHLLGDGVCQPECNSAGCLFDMRDCNDESKRQTWVDTLASHAQSPVPIISLQPPGGKPSQLWEATICQNTDAPWLRGGASTSEVLTVQQDLSVSTDIGSEKLAYGTVDEQPCGYNYNITALKWLLDFTVEEPGQSDPFDATDFEPCAAMGNLEMSKSVCNAIKKAQGSNDVKDVQQMKTKVHKDSMIIAQPTIESWNNWHIRNVAIEGDEGKETRELIVSGFRHLLAAELVKSISTHGCRNKCNISACGFDAGTCFDKHWCAPKTDTSPGCPPAKNTDQTCDPECFTLECGWDSPSCDQCDIFVSPENGLYKDAIASSSSRRLAESAEAADQGGGSMIIVYLYLGATVAIFIMRVRGSILSALEGYDDPFGDALGSPWSKGRSEEVERVRGMGGVMALGTKSTLNYYLAPVWPLPKASPLQEKISADWTLDQNETDSVGRAGLIYNDTAAQYTSDDGEPLRIELHQAQTAALSTIMTVIFMLSCPLIASFAAAKPGLGGAPFLSQISVGNIYDPNTACKYDTPANLLLQNSLAELSEVTCGDLPWSAHATLFANVAVCICFILLVATRHKDLEKLATAVPHLGDYCIHVSGLGVSSKKALEIRALVSQLPWIKDNLDDVEFHNIWGDDLQWGWARRQVAQLEAAGKGASERCNVLKGLVGALAQSRTNVGFPRPFAGHTLLVCHKQHMAKACLHAHKKSIVDRAMHLLPIQPDGTKKSKKIEIVKEGEKPNKSAKVNAHISAGFEPSDIDYLSMLSGGSSSVEDKWRGWAATLGALLTGVAVLMVALALIFMMKQEQTGAAGCSFLLLLITEVGGFLVQTATKKVPRREASQPVIATLNNVHTGHTPLKFSLRPQAARYKVHTFSGQRQATLLALVMVQSCTLILFPYILLGDPFSWNSAATGTLTGIFGKCRKVVELTLGSELVSGRTHITLTSDHTPLPWACGCLPAHPRRVRAAGRGVRPWWFRGCRGLDPDLQRDAAARNPAARAGQVAGAPVGASAGAAESSYPTTSGVVPTS
jgi:hypothetical protein